MSAAPPSADRWRRRAAELAIGLGAAALMVSVAFRDVVFGGRTLSTAWEAISSNGFLPPPGAGVDIPNQGFRADPGASAWQFEPWAQLVHRLMAHWELPLWNPSQGAGAPLAANMQSAVLDPLLLPVHLHPSPLVWDITLLGALVLGILLTYLYLRSLELDRLASVAGSLVFGLSGYFFNYSNNQFFRSYIYVPLLLLLIDRAIRSDRLRWVAALAAAVAGNIVLGMPEATFAVLCLAGAYALYRVLTLRVGGRPWAVVRLTGAGALGLCLAAPILLLFVEYTSLGFTAHPPGGSIGVAHDPVRWLILWAVPFGDGRPLATPDVVRDWIGAGALTLVVFGISSTEEVRRRPVAFFALVITAILLKVYGFPLVQAVGGLPLASQANFPRYFTPLAGFCGAALAACGVQAIAHRTWHRYGVMAGMALVAIGGALLLRANDAALAVLTIRYLGRQYGVAVAAASLVVLAAIVLKPRVARWVAVAVVVGELLALAPQGIYATRANPYEPPAWLAAAGYGGDATDRVFAFDGKLFPDIAAAFGMEDIRALDALYPNRYVTYIKTFIQPDFGTRFVGGAYSQDEGGAQAHVVGNPMADLLGLRYVVAGPTTPDDPFVVATLAARAEDAAVHSAVLRLGDDRRQVLLQESGSEVSIPVTRQDPRRVVFSYGMDPAAWADPANDGVVFAIDGVTRGGRRIPVGRAAYIPRTDPVSPAFRTADLALPPALQSDVSALSLRIEPRGEARGVSAGWSSLRVVGPGAEGAGPQLRHVGFFTNLDVYENTGRLPRAFVASNLTYVPDASSAVQALRKDEPRFADGAVNVTNFNPRTDAVVEGSAPGTAGSPCAPGGSAVISNYSADEVTVSADSPCAGLVVLSDTYYPGWVATVNGSPATIHPTDILFRGVPIERGHSTVVFRYQPSGLGLGMLMALGGLAVLMAVGGWRYLRRRAHAAPAGTR